MIDQSKTYRTRSGKAVRILCTDGPDVSYPVLAFIDGDYRLYSTDGLASAGICVGLASQNQAYSLVESDPHGILPRHRELLAEQLEAPAFAGPPTVWDIRNTSVDELPAVYRAALIALARLDGEKGE